MLGLSKVVKPIKSEDLVKKKHNKEKKGTISFEQVQGCVLANIYIYIYILGLYAP